MENEKSRETEWNENERDEKRKGRKKGKKQWEGIRTGHFQLFSNQHAAARNEERR